MSLTNYIPLDKFAPAVFSSAQASNYTNIAFIMLLLYDHIITLDKEIGWIWTLRWRLPKIIFMINRYLLTSLIVLANVPETIFPLPLSVCKFGNNFLLGWSPIFNFSAAELLMIIRVSSLYGHHKFLVWSLGGLFVFAFVGTSVAQVLFKRTYFTIFYYESLPGCYWASSAYTDIQWHVWVPTLTVEGILMLLTAYKLITYRHHMNRTITVLARDSITYFVLIFVGITLAVVDEIRPIIPGAVLIPIQCITSIAVGRMMMNIRGLILDDQEHTVRLRTLQFNDTSDSEEVALRPI
ncbi:hypothetical protein PILCRDRAFT_829403 [Piloderma croceum F 1598]|uniref:DUF6533 domain-containing protein n=1 Tax=Piloderma croceum (strain F 1598) TaxID=765440 RepID=A0A0C3EYW0_PILCF|nr:hypothetical protein PILCRDRAFT_829403 [Piloderma croceum F 1598]